MNLSPNLKMEGEIQVMNEMVHPLSEQLTNLSMQKITQNKYKLYFNEKSWSRLWM